MKKIYTILFIIITLPFYSQWVPQNSGVTQNLNDVYCITADNVVVVGDNGHILKTTDGGINWVQKTSGTTQGLTRIKFINQNTGFATGSGGILLKTIDGGENWSTISIGGTTNLFGLSVLNESTFIISGDYGLIKKTTDGGATFTTLNAPENQTVIDIQFFSEQVGYVLTGDINWNFENKLYKTINGGTTWELVTQDFVDSFYFVNENLGFISSKQNGFLKTTNSGITTTTIGYSNNQEVAIFSVNGDVVWDLGDNYTLCNCSYFCIGKKITTDNQPIQNVNNCISNWQNGSAYRAIHFANESNGYIVGDYGKIYKNSTGTMEEATAGIDEFNKNPIQIYPNPTTGTINFSKNIVLNSIEIIDNLGRSVKQFYKVENNTLELKELSNGVYFCIIHSNGEKITQKIIVEK